MSPRLEIQFRRSLIGLYIYIYVFNTKSKEAKVKEKAVEFAAHLVWQLEQCKVSLTLTLTSDSRCAPCCHKRGPGVESCQYDHHVWNGGNAATCYNIPTYGPITVTLCLQEVRFAFRMRFLNVLSSAFGSN
jgi:hypothetical protein